MRYTFIRVEASTSRAKAEVVDQATGERLADLSQYVAGWSVKQDFGGDRIARLTLEIPVEVANIETLQIGKTRPA